MTLSFRAAFAAGALLCFVATGCVESDNPLSDDKSTKIDTALVGTWEYKEEGKDAQAMIVEKDPANAKGLIIHSAKPEEAKEQVEAITTSLGGKNYLSLGGQDPSKPKTWLFARYEISGDTGKIFVMDSEVVAKDVEKGVLKGDVKREFGTSVHLHESTEKLRAYVEKNTATCFPEKAVINLKKIK